MTMYQLDREAIIKDVKFKQKQIAANSLNNRFLTVQIQKRLEEMYDLSMGCRLMAKHFRTKQFCPSYYTGEISSDVSEFGFLGSPVIKVRYFNVAKGTLDLRQYSCAYYRPAGPEETPLMPDYSSFRREAQSR